MNLFLIITYAISLSMDAFAVAICKGLSVKKAGIKEMAKAGLWFGGFQALMPSLGYILGVSAQKIIQPIDHIIAFLLEYSYIINGYVNKIKKGKIALYATNVAHHATF